MWEADFQFQLGIAWEKGDKAILTFLKHIIDLVKKGRYILRALWHVGVGTCDGDYGTLIDLFSQGMALAVEITSEVKFFEVKIEEFVAITPDGGGLKIKLLRELFNELLEDWMDDSSQSTDEEVSDSSG